MRHAALGLLADQPASGYDLLKLFQLSMDMVWPATQSQLYGELNKMAAEGLIKVANLGPRGRKEYAITDAGRAELQRWMLSPHEDPPIRNAALLRVLMLGLVTSDQQREYMETYRATAERDLARYEQIRDSHEWTDSDDDFFANAVLENGLRWSKAKAEWASWVIDALDRRARASGAS
ncbi:transcriptional regulator [Mycolicibacterium moriokaense]|uniref:Transcriptional regulator n=1 Tax=Mycolicibacterium moriokaense TaxID=39691 RepID=A0AAD1HJD5_9MYCO|nr:transcriptional regulator [Mycolicibacterium moriokaense]